MWYRKEDVEVIRETEEGYADKGALLVQVEGEEVWIPKSQIHDDSEVYAMDTSGTLIIPTWLAESKGLV